MLNGFLNHARRKIGKRKVQVLRQAACGCLPKPTRTTPDIKDAVAGLERKLPCYPRKPAGFGDRVLAVQPGASRKLAAIAILLCIA